MKSPRKARWLAASLVATTFVVPPAEEASAATCSVTNWCAWKDSSFDYLHQWGDYTDQGDWGQVGYANKDYYVSNRTTATERAWSGRWQAGSLLYSVAESIGRYGKMNAESSYYVRGS